jgi:diguanylate cyclase (GGDEF)-like protein
VWGFTATIALTAVLIGWLLRDEPALHLPALPWWILVLGFYGAELLVVHLRFRRDAHSFSMSDIPLVVGLFGVAPVMLLVAQVLGNLIVFVVHRRQPPVKLAFNIAQYALQAAVAIVVLRAIVSTAELFGLVSWLGAVTATLAALLVAHVMVNVVIRLSGGSLAMGEILEAVGFSSIATGMNTVLGMLVASALFDGPRAAAFAGIPALVLFAAYRSYVAARQERAQLRALYGATRALHESPQLEVAVLTAASHARTMFEAQYCEIVLGNPMDSSTAYRWVVGPGEHRVTMEPVPFGLWQTIWEKTSSEGSAIALGPAEGRTAPSGITIADAMVAPIMIGPDHVGIVFVANHLGDIAVFQKVDLELLQTLADQVGVSVENGRLEESLSALTELKEELRHQALHDSLTGLANRALFAEQVGHAMHRIERTDGQLAVLFLDLDDFKTVNDSLGHAAGDELLVAVGKRLQGHCRPADTVARLGGDEFAVLLEDIDGSHSATDVAERILESLSAPFWIHGREVTVGASIGIAFDSDGATSGEVLSNADAAMYVAKRHGKRTFRLFEPSMHAEVVMRFQIRADLELALNSGGLELRYQPIVDLESGSLRGFEALVRWPNPLRGELSPTEFIPIAEGSGMIHRMGRWVLREALRQQRACERELRSDWDFEMCVNLSAKQLENPEFVADVEAAIAEFGVRPDTLVLEITESAMMHTQPVMLERLRRLGVRLAVDDFGTGYSSLASLDRLPVDVLKIDRAFVARMTDATAPAPLVATIVGLGDVLGLQTIAEGIETPVQLEAVRRLGCRFGQGFLFSEPLDADAALELARRQAAGKSLYTEHPHLRAVL